MPITSYLDFDLLIVPAADKTTVRVIHSPAGQAAADFVLPFAANEIPTFEPRAGSHGRHIFASAAGAADGARLTPRTFGERLYTALFTDPIEQLFRRSLDAANRQDAGLRVRLRLGDAPALAALPWEFLYSPSLDRFLALSDATPVIRYLELAQPEAALAVAPPLNILTVVADPSDVQQLDVEQEWSRLQTATRELEARNLVRLDRLPKATPGALQQRLRQADVHILHFIGHGLFDAQTGAGALVFEQETGKSVLLSGSQLGALLHDQRSLRLVFLNACEGAATSPGLPFAGVAQQLVQQSNPAVLAMQFAVSDAAAVALASEFYRALADGAPVDTATSEARKAVYAAGEEFEWGTPVLFSRSPDGVILDLARGKEEPVTQPDEKPWWNSISASGDVIIATVGAGARNVAVGKQITQQVYDLIGPPTPDDKQVITQQLAQVGQALTAHQAAIDAANMKVAELQLQLLRGELTKTADGETPSAAAITLAGNWLLDNIPQIAEALTGLFATPAVARVVGKAGEAAVAWVKERFGRG